MAGDKLKGPFSYKVAKKILSQSDLERLACAFLATENVYQFDHNKAAKEFGGSKPDSFKRQIWVITKKIKEEMSKGGEDVADSIEEEKPKTKTAGGAGKKRKATAGSEEGGEKRGKEKKAKVGGSEDLAVKAEGDGDDEDGYL